MPEESSYGFTLRNDVRFGDSMATVRAKETLPFDEDRCTQERLRTLKGTVAALKRFADFGKTLAAETGSEVVDWNTAYQNLVVAEQRKNPAFSFVRPDRVHPDS